MSKRATAATVITVALALSACGGGSDNAGTTEPPPVTAVDPGPEPTEPPVTEPATTTSSTTEVPPAATTEPAPTTTEPSIEDQVRAASHEYDDFYVECLRAPDDCDTGEYTIAGSDARGALSKTVGDLAAGGLFVGDEDPGTSVIESIELKDDHTLVTVCYYTTMVLYLLPPIDGAEPTVQNDTPGTVREEFQWVQDPEDSRWKIRRSDVTLNESGVDLCASEQ